VPSEYVVCFGVLHDPDAATPRPLDVTTLLPESARDLIRIDDRVEQDSMHPDYGCARLTTDDARALAEALDDAGIQHDLATDYLLYGLPDPDGPYEIRVQFGPVLPHGEDVYLGPG
jgi:hypothetical protein